MVQGYITAMKLLLIPIILLLTSCNSFNSLVLTSYELSTNNIEDHPTRSTKDKTHQKPIKKPKPEVQVIEVPVVKKEYVYRCEKYILPELIDPPSFPFDRLQKVGTNDLKAVDEILMDHITSLHKHEKKIRSLIHESYSKYSKKC